MSRDVERVTQCLSYFPCRDCLTIEHMCLGYNVDDEGVGIYPEARGEGVRSSHWLAFICIQTVILSPG